MTKSKTITDEKSFVGESIGGTRFFSKNESKAWAEKFFLAYGPIWMLYFVFLIYYEIYEGASKLGWTMFGVIMATPNIVHPKLPLTQRYWFKANVWILIFNFVGNYFWTHYFFNLLGARYTLEAYSINNIPYLMFFCTQAYFTFYFTLSNVLLRLINTSMTQSTKRTLTISLFLCAFCYFTAYMETLTIQHFKYYTFTNRDAMYKYGSIFYALYFIVGQSSSV